MTPKRVLGLFGVGALVAVPWIRGVPLSLVTNLNQAGEYAIIAISLVVLTGWVGQISLAQATFVGVGAFTTGILARSAHIPFPLSLPFAAAITAGAAAMLGLVALRVRGLYLAVATLIFAWIADAYLFSQSWLVGAGNASIIGNRPIGVPGTVTFFDLSNKKVFYVVIVAAVSAVYFAAQNLRDSKSGRALFALRGSETAAASLGIDVTRYKLVAFGISGALAGIAGNLLMTDLRTATPDGFTFTKSLFYLSIAVVGGISSLGGAIAAGLLFAGLDQLFVQFKFLNGTYDIVAVGLLLAVLLAYPGGLGALGVPIARAVAPVARKMRRRLRLRISLKAPIRRRRRGEIERHSLDLDRLRVLEPEPRADELMVLGAAAVAHRDWRSMSASLFELPQPRSARALILEARDITVRFGGITAVNNVSLEVREREIVGLIGPNGAGKTTTFNAISGLNEPSAGRVLLFGTDATRYPVHVRAQMGVGRTFQLVQLFGRLSVFENLLVATHVHNNTGLFSHLAVTDRALDAEADGRQHVRRIVALLGLEDVADRPIAGLPFGILRQVEIARALVTRAPLLMLDEPASGLDNSETDDLARLLYFIRAELGVSVLLIEHDVKMVTAVSDYMYVIDQGSLLAEGIPSVVQRHPEVVAAYLGEQPVNR